IGITQILVQHRHNANWEVTGNPTTNLEETDARSFRSAHVPLSKGAHVFDPAAHSVDVLHVSRNHVARKDVSKSGVFPTRDHHWEVLFSGGKQPRIFRIDLIVLFQFSREQDFIHE